MCACGESVAVEVAPLDTEATASFFAEGAVSDTLDASCCAAAAGGGKTPAVVEGVVEAVAVGVEEEVSV